MSTKHVRTTGDLIRFGLKLKIECGQCGSTNLLTTREIAEKMGGSVSLAALHPRLRCSECAAHAAKLNYLS